MADPRSAAFHVGSLDDAALEAALRALGAQLAMPAADTADGRRAARVRARIEASRPARAALFLMLEPAGRRLPGRPRIRRGVVLALAATLVLAAVAAAAVGFDLPGLRIIFGPAPTVPAVTSPPSPGGSVPRLPGSGLGLGTAVPLADAARLVDFAVALPRDPDPGPPDAVYHRLGRLALVWGASSDLPPTADPDIGLLLSEFRGRLDETIVLKIADAGTRVEPVTVAGAPGYWIEGELHFFAYLDPDGAQIVDSRRTVGDTLVWTNDGITYRLESSLGRDAAIRLAASLR